MYLKCKALISNQEPLPPPIIYYIITPAPKKLTKEQMAENKKKQKAEFTRRLRSELCGPMFKDVLITVEHDPEVLAGADLLDFIPSLIQGRLSM